jgi:SAM-dependent methyltransferase
MRRPLRRKTSPDPLAATVLDGKLVDVLPLLRCPRTGSELKPAEDGSLLGEGRRRYPVVDGVPVLIDEDRSLADSWTLQSQLKPDDEALPESGLRALVERWRRWLPTNSRDVATKRNHRRLVELLRVRAASGRRPWVLVVGGPGEGDGSQELLRCAELQVIEADLTFGPRADVICDGHNLPFSDRSFDAVVIPAALDCVVDPQRVASEVHRVLAEHGLVYSEAGFIQQVHGGAFDFNRFTHLGHRRLWRYFDEVDSGAQRGPGTALLWSTEYFFRAFVGESRILRAVIAHAVALFGFWVKYLDDFLVRRPGGIDAASRTFFLGTRRETPVPDRAIVAGFRGIFPDGQRLPTVRPEAAGEADEEIRVSRGIRIRRKERTASGV